MYLGHRQHCWRKIDLVVYCLIVDCVTNCGSIVAAVVVVAVVSPAVDRIWAAIVAYVVHVILINLETFRENYSWYRIGRRKPNDQFYDTIKKTHH